MHSSEDATTDTIVNGNGQLTVSSDGSEEKTFFGNILQLVENP